MTRICNFPIAKDKRCGQPVTDDKPNCGRHRCEISAQQLRQDPVVYERGDELHVWAGKPNGPYCLIHSDPAYQVLCQLTGEKVRCCLQEGITCEDEQGKWHRDDGPALIWTNGTQEWYQHGEKHRDDGPAVISTNGAQFWYRHGERHRDDGPARIWPDGTQHWYQHGELHREDGPAVINLAATQPDDIQVWYWHGQEATEEEHARLRAKRETKKRKR